MNRAPDVIVTSQEHDTIHLESTFESIDQQAKRPRTSYDCDLCRKSYTEKRSLLRHFKTPTHCKAAGLRVPSYSCKYCGQHMSRQDLCLRHENEVHLSLKRSFGHSGAASLSGGLSSTGITGVTQCNQNLEISTNSSMPSLCSTTTFNIRRALQYF